jgi:hypothetical protein
MKAYDELAAWATDIERIQREHAEMVAAQSWMRFWAEGHAATFEQLTPGAQQLVCIQHGSPQPVHSLWRIINGETIPVPYPTLPAVGNPS